MIKRYFSYSPFLSFSPFLALFALLVVRSHNPELGGDEVRYYQFAQNLLHGFYSPPPPDINLWNGPGYPLFIAPFLLLKLPTIAIALANAVMQYLSIVVLYKLLLKRVSHSKAIVFSLCWGFYYISYQEIPTLSSETLSMFLCILSVWAVAKLSGQYAKRYVLFAAVTLGLLVLTKIIFAYVLLTLLMGYAALAIVRRSNFARRMVVVLALSFAVTLPYLIYTYSLTGKLFYWGNSGGMSLYWMSTPYAGEFGDWNNETFTANCGHDTTMPCNAAILAAHHQSDIDYVNRFTGVEKDEAYKQLAIANIRKHPVKYVRNCISNFSRMLFGFPNSYFYQREQSFFRIVPNAFLISGLFICMLFAIRSRLRLSRELSFAMAFVVLYLGASILVSAYARMFYIIVPLLLFYIAVVCGQLFVIRKING